MTVIVADTTCELRRALAPLVEVVTESCEGGDEAYLSVLQVEGEKEAAALARELKSQVPVSDIPIYELPPAIIIHAGFKAMGVGFFVTPTQPPPKFNMRISIEIQIVLSNLGEVPKAEGGGIILPLIA